MYPASSRFLATLRVPHAVAFEATIETPAGLSIPIPVAGGSVTVDGTAMIRRTAQLEVPWTADPRDAVELGVDPRQLPFGSYIRLRRGIRYPDGTTETLPIGRLRIDAVAWKTIAASASFELADPMAQVTDTLLHYVFDPAGKTTQQSIVALVNECFTTPPALLDSTVASAVLRDFNQQSDRGSAITQLAQGIAATVYFDVNGALVIAPVPNPVIASSAVWTVDAGETGVMVDTDEGYDRAQAVNGVYVRGIGAWDQAPFEVLVTDNDPASPMQWGGTFGKVAVELQLSSVVDMAGINAAAAALFRQRCGLSRSLSILAVPNPALDVGDTIKVVYPDGSSELQAITGMRLPLGATEPMTLTVAGRYTSSAGGSLMRVYAGEQAWRELRETKLVSA